VYAFFTLCIPTYSPAGLEKRQFPTQSTLNMLFCTETLKHDTCLQVLERGINSCPKSRTILDNSVLAALDQSGLPAFLPHPIRSLTRSCPREHVGWNVPSPGPAIAPPP